MRVYHGSGFTLHSVINYVPFQLDFLSHYIGDEEQEKFRTVLPFEPGKTVMGRY